MRLRTLIELLAALILTFAALFAVSKMARTSAMKVENSYAFATIIEVRTSAAYETMNDAGNELQLWLHCNELRPHVRKDEVKAS